MPRLRELNPDLSEHMPTGTLNAITDIVGVRVGHVTLTPEESPHICTGVTAILPHDRNLFREKVYVAVHTMNGFGKATGFEQVRETGYIEAPILLTNTLSVGAALDAGFAWMVKETPEIGQRGRGSVNVVVAECNDSFLNDMRGFHITREHVWCAIEAAHGGAVEEGAVGAAAGTQCYQFKGGIGTASRVMSAENGGYTVGALVQTNMGKRQHLRILGARVGKHLTEVDMPTPPPGSIIIVIGTDAPCSPSQLERVARRAPFGLARTGTTCAAGSGDFAIAFSTARAMGLPDDDTVLDELFTATVEAVEEAILNALLQAKTVIGKDGNTLHGIPIEQVKRLLER